MSKALVHRFLATLLETTPATVDRQMRKDPSEFPRLPTIDVNIDLTADR